MYEYAGTIHLHTTYSDGTGTLDEVVRIAEEVGLDFIIPTDHNVYVSGRDGWYGRTLLLVGEEIHDENREPEANHYLALNIHEDVSHLAPDPQAVIDAVNAQGGFGFIAHPFETAAPLIGEGALNWVDWQVTGYTGLSIWNYMSEMKDHVPNKWQALLLVYWPKLFIRGYSTRNLRKWDELLRTRKTVAICTSDAHAQTYSLGPLQRVVYPYAYLFRAAQIHILSEEPFNGELAHDREVVYEALRQGHCFTVYGLMGDGRGFRFTATSGSRTAIMGDELPLQGEVTFEVRAPRRAYLRLLRDGEEVARTRGQQLRYTTAQKGVYRVEAYRSYLFRRKGWVFTNPIYVR